MEVQVSYLAVFLAGLSSMVVGSIWYAKGVFGTTWARLAHVDLDREMKSGEIVKLMGTTFLISLVTAYVLAHLAFLSNNFFQNSFLQDALMTAFWVWLGFTALRFWTHDMFETRPGKLTLLSVSNEFITIMVMGLIIGAIKP